MEPVESSQGDDLDAQGVTPRAVVFGALGRKRRISPTIAPTQFDALRAQSVSPWDDSWLYGYAETSLCTLSHRGASLEDLLRSP